MDGQLEAKFTQAGSDGPDLIIITGMSGAGRTEAMHTFEDLGYFCIDNLPPSLLINLVSLAGRPDGVQRKLAVVCDLRAREFFPELIEELKRISELGLTYVVLFLDSDTKSLLTRFKQTRRRHPLCDAGMTIVAGIEKERGLLADAKEIADYVIDTARMKPQELRKQIRRIDRNRARYYTDCTGQTWGDKQFYDLCLNTTGKNIKQLVPSLARMLE